MCGIAGFIDPRTPLESRGDAVRKMCDAMLHRGPDDAGIESRGEATIGMRRLAIFDPANGHQPMQTRDGRFTLVFNGAIYNFHALKAELASAGWSFRTNCDTEVLLAAYAQWGESCLGKLRGMFAFAAWDAQQESLFLARDPFGIKPLYYRHDGDRLLFASELNALLAGGVFQAAIDPVSVSEYLAWFAVPAPRTIYRGVYSLRPGECATFHRGQLDIRSAWSFRTIPRTITTCLSHEEFIGELRGRLDDSIRAHTLADVPVGVFLSGGLDSAVIAGLMTQATGARLKTFSIGFDEGEFSEATEAKETARHLGAEHHSRILKGSEVAADLDRILATYDQPTGDGINTYYVSETAHQGGVKVALSGLGGDELFGGYPSFKNLPRISRWLPLWWSLPKAVRNSVIANLRRGNTRTRKFADFLRYAHDVHELASMQRRVFSEPRRRSLLSPETLETVSERIPFHPDLPALRSDLQNAATFEIASAWELRTYMADLLLRDSDVMSMRHSLELRVPFVDRPLIEWLWRQPTNFKFTPKHPKDALAEAAIDILPPHMRSRRKHGFTLPFAVWMRRELKPFLDSAFDDSSVEKSGLFQRREVQSLWRNFLHDRDDRGWSRVWSLAVLISFTNRRLPAPAVPSAPHIRTSRQEDLPQAPRPAAVGDDAPIRRGFKRVTLLMAPEIFSSVGGIPRILQLYLKALCELAEEKNDAVRLVALNDPVLDSSDLRRYAIADRLDNWVVCDRKKRRFVRESLRLAKRCDRLICGHVAQLPVARMAKLLRPRLKYYLVAHGIEVWREFKLTERIALRGAERILCVSDYTRTELLKNCPGLKPERVVVLPNALDPVFAIENGTPLAECPSTVLTVTRLTYNDRYKGVETLISAMPAVRASIPDASLRIVGRGDDLPRLQGIARQHGLVGKGVEFVGYIDDRRLDQELRSCRLFALPSKKEGFGLVFLEAMAHGRPCLGARAGGIPEVITEDTGVLVEFGDVPGVAAAIVAALRRSWNEDAMLERADAFSYQRFKERLDAIIDPK
jgi:asparagine synthase (glutamine-hydrolysing)